MCVCLRQLIKIIFRSIFHTCVSCAIFIGKANRDDTDSKYWNANDLLNIPFDNGIPPAKNGIVSYFVYHKIVADRSCVHTFVFSIRISPITSDVWSNGITRISYFFYMYWPLLESLVTRFSANSFTKYFTWSNTCVRAFGLLVRKKVRLKNE